MVNATTTEGSSTYIPLALHRPHHVPDFSQDAYTGSYGMLVPSPNNPMNDVYLPLRHARVVLFADAYGIEALMITALDKLERAVYTLKRRPQVAEGGGAASHGVTHAGAGMIKAIDREVLPERTIYVSYNLPITYGAPVITDYSAARLGEPGEKYPGDVMPGVFRTPEIIMGADWDYKIDMWAFGVMIWDLFEGTRRFHAVSADLLNDEMHLAEMASRLQPPPVAFLERHENASKYWDADGNWIAATPIPDQTLESREIKLRGPVKEIFMKFVRKALCWLPDDRAATEDLYEDEFLEFLNGY